jgi:hypothetical protein
MLSLQQTAGEQLFRMILKQPLFFTSFHCDLFSGPEIFPDNLAFKGTGQLIGKCMSRQYSRYSLPLSGWSRPRHPLIYTRRRMQQSRKLFLQRTAEVQPFRMISKQPLFSPPFHFSWLFLCPCGMAGRNGSCNDLIALGSLPWEVPVTGNNLQ